MNIPRPETGVRTDEGSVTSASGERTQEPEGEGQTSQNQSQDGQGSHGWHDHHWRGSWNGWHGGWQWYTNPWWSGQWNWKQEPQSWGHGAASTSAEDEEDDAIVDVLPDAVQGWFLLEKCGLDPLERSVIG